VRRRLFACIETILDDMREKDIQTTTSGEVYYLTQEKMKGRAPTRREVISHLNSYRKRLRIRYTRNLAKLPRRERGAYVINIL
jgi:hypothetical protein